MSGRGRLQALSALTRVLSPEERQQYDESRRTRRAYMSFDADSKLSADERGRVLQQLSVLAAEPKIKASEAPGSRPATPTAPARKLSVFELARLRREVQSAASSAEAPEVVRQVAWSIEEGALRRFDPAHAIHIALKKIRQGAWTRPNRMPPNWSRG